MSRRKAQREEEVGSKKKTKWLGKEKEGEEKMVEKGGIREEVKGRD